MATSIDNRQGDFSEMDNAGISKEHWKIMFISGNGLFYRRLRSVRYRRCHGASQAHVACRQSWRKASSNQLPC